MNENISFIDKIIAPYNRNRNIFHDTSALISVCENWYDVLLFQLGMRKRIRIKFRDGFKVDIRSKKEYFALWNTKEVLTQAIKAHNPLRIKIRNGIIAFFYKNIWFKFCYCSKRDLIAALGSINEQFIDEPYSELEVKDKTVLDIGAFDGLSAIYFILKGAKHVYSFEPFPYHFNVAKKNISLNEMGDKITLLNVGAGGKDKEVVLRQTHLDPTISTLENSNKGKKVHILTLESIIRRYNIRDAAMKIDCEGPEYEIILNSNRQTLRAFKQIIIEYHKGYVNLAKKFNDVGFSVKHSLPIRSKHNLAEYTYQGIISARQKER